MREYRRRCLNYDFRQPDQQGDDDLDLCFSSDGFLFSVHPLNKRAEGIDRFDLIEYGMIFSMSYIRLCQLHNQLL